MLAFHSASTSTLQAWGIFVQHVPGIERFPRNWIRGVRPVVEARRALDALIVMSWFRFVSRPWLVICLRGRGGYTSL